MAPPTAPSTLSQYITDGLPKQDDETLAAPFTGTDCLIYEYAIEELRRNRDSD